MAVRYYISLPDPARARGGDPAFSFDAHGADEFAAQLQHALRTSSLFERWRARQDDPDDVDPAWAPWTRMPWSPASRTTSASCWSPVLPFPVMS